MKLLKELFIFLIYVTIAAPIVITFLITIKPTWLGWAYGLCFATFIYDYLNHVRFKKEGKI